MEPQQKRTLKHRMYGRIGEMGKYRRYSCGSAGRLLPSCSLRTVYHNRFAPQPRPSFHAFGAFRVFSVFSVFGVFGVFGVFFLILGIDFIANGIAKIETRKTRTLETPKTQTNSKKYSVAFPA